MSKTMIIFLLFLQINCNSQDSEREMKKQYSCILEEVKKNKVEAYGIEFRQQLSDTLSSWIKNVDNKFMRAYRIDNYLFEISENTLFNKTYSKGLGFIVDYRKPGEFLDFVKIITGEKAEDGSWEFYFIGNPSLSFDQYGDSLQRLKPVTKKDRERRVLEMILSDGYYKKDCKRDYRYFEKQWFPEWIKIKHKSEFYKPD